MGSHHRRCVARTAVRPGNANQPGSRGEPSYWLIAPARSEEWGSIPRPAGTARLGRRRAAALKEAGLIYSSSGPDEVHVSDDVRFSLRYSDDDHIARELGEPPLPARAAIGPARDDSAGPGARE